MTARTTGTWKPDWDALRDAGYEAMTKAQRTATRPSVLYDQAVIECYRRQQAAQGIVEVRRDELERAKRMIEGILNHRSRFSAEQLADINMLWRHLDRLAAAREQGQ